MPPALPLRTDRLVLRPMTPDDAPPIHSYKSQPDTVHFLPHGPLTLDEVLDRIGTRWAGRDLQADDDALCLAAEEPDTGRIIGDVVLFLRSVENRGGEVGYVFAPEARGKGYATEAAAAMLRLGFEHYGLHRIIGRIDARNAASAAVLERLGMRCEAHFVRNELWKGEWTDEVIYAVLAEEWTGAPLS